MHKEGVGTKLRAREQQERHPESGRVELNDGKFFSVIGASRVRLPYIIGRVQKRMLSIQDKISRGGVTSRSARVLAMLNCRKSGDLARSTVQLRQLVDSDALKLTSTKEIFDYVDSAERDRDGVLEMFRDVNSFIQNGRHAVCWENTRSAHVDWLREVISGDVFPQTVHIFSFKKSTPADVRLRAKAGMLSLVDFARLGFVHTFLVTGHDTKRDMLHCFHKQGPQLDQGIEVVSGDTFLLRFNEDYGQDPETFVAISGSNVFLS